MPLEEPVRCNLERQLVQVVISGRAEQPFVTASLLDRHRGLQPLQSPEKGKGRKAGWLFSHFHEHLFEFDKLQGATSELGRLSQITGVIASQVKSVSHIALEG